MYRYNIYVNVKLVCVCVCVCVSTNSLTPIWVVELIFHSLFFQSYFSLLFLRKQKRIYSNRVSVYVVFSLNYISFNFLVSLPLFRKLIVDSTPLDTTATSCCKKFNMADTRIWAGNTTTATYLGKIVFHVVGLGFWRQ